MAVPESVTDGLVTKNLTTVGEATSFNAMRRYSDDITHDGLRGQDARAQQNQEWLRSQILFDEGVAARADARFWSSEQKRAHLRDVREIGPLEASSLVDAQTRDAGAQTIERLSAALNSAAIGSKVPLNVPPETGRPTTGTRDAERLSPNA